MAWCMSHRLTFAAVFLLTLVGGCNAGISLVDRPLHGLVLADSRFEQIPNRILFTFDDEDAPLDRSDTDDCPYLGAGAVRFDDAVVDEDFGGRDQQILFNNGCLSLIVSADTSSDEQRDATLEITSGPEQDIVRYTGLGLMADRRLVALDSLDVVAGGSLRLGYAAPSDTLRNLEVYVDIDGDRFDFSASGTEDVLTVSVPANTPAGAHIMIVSFGIDVDTEQCDGFASCEVRGAVEQEFDVTVTR